MVQVQIKTNTTRKTKNVDVNTTPAAIFAESEISTAGAAINLNGTILSATDLQSSLAALGVSDGTSIYLNCVVKADGANK